MKKLHLFIPCFLISFLCKAQMTIQAGAILYIESGAKITLQGDLISNADIQGSGTIAMKGSSVQSITMNGFAVPNLEIDNVANVTLSGSAARIGMNLLFTNGKLLTAAHDLYIASAATIAGNSISRFIWTDGTGQVRKELAADIVNFEIPVGVNGAYRPVYLTTAGSTYSGANVGVRSVSGASGHKPPMMASYITSYWPVTRTGITGGAVSLVGQYADPADVTGTEANLSGYYFNGMDWSSVNETHDAATNQVSAPISVASGELTAMNKFVTVGSRALLQGTYDNVTGLMNDGLRQGGNVIPVNDPYRLAPYSSSFTHVANTTAEMVSGTVFNNQASINDNIVDWVFLELRNTTTSPGNLILQTRSALIQRDGDIVDIDGISPVTFNNVTNGSYTIAVRHRNHLGVATLPTSPKTFSEAKSIAFTANVADLRNVGTPLFGSSTAYAINTHPSLGTINLLWAGNANSNGNVRFTGLINDKDYILITILGDNPSSVLSNSYSPADINMNKIVRYNGLLNDKDFLYINILESNAITSRTQSLPN